MADNNTSQKSGKKEKQKTTNSQSQPNDRTTPPDRRDEYKDEGLK